MKKFIVFTAVIVLMICGITNSAHAGDADVLKRVLESRQIRVGMSGNQPPMNVASKTGAFIGLEVDLANLMAETMGVKLTMVPMPFPKLLDALNAGEVDMVMSNMSITPQRTLSVSFVGPYMMSGRSILTRSAILAKASRPADLNKAEIKIVALGNSTSQQFVERQLKKATLETTEDYDKAIQMVKDGAADLMVADMTICLLAVMRNPEAGLLTLSSPLNIEPIGIAVSAQDAQFENLVSNVLDTLEGVGILDQLRKKWLEDDSWVSSIP
jgi:polar amino acid transport system substrate-binding protein